MSLSMYQASVPVFINFLENISGMYKAAAKATEKINKKYAVMSKAIETAVEKVGPKINLAKNSLSRQRF